ncbi:MAG: ATP-binding cassette domain-containing protein [Pseudomonadota bacterium]|nr:ATP-binding cassette domain-containing protein [Pseudomonadota bacterium]
MRKLKISVKDLVKKFDKKTVLENLDLEIYESESLSIIGESGSGKSILTRCIIGLIDFDQGLISFEEIENIKYLSANQKNNYISKFGILFQNSALLDSLNIEENLRFANKKEDLSKILNEVGLPKSILKKFPSDLSVGMQKRVGLARAVIKKPDVLILDEPTTGLDPLIARQINILIKELVKQKKITTITVTHDMDSVYEFADYVAFLKDGIIDWYGSARKINKTKKSSVNNFIKGIVE